MSDRLPTTSLGCDYPPKGLDNTVAELYEVR
jgi:hypothetical protein